MYVSQIKALSWLATFGLTGGMGWYVYDYAAHANDPGNVIDPDAVRAKLDDVPRVEPEKNDIVSYDDVHRVFHTFDWVGNPPPDPAAAKPDVEVEKPKTTSVPVAQLVSIQMIQEDTANPAKSSVFLKYQLASQVRDPRMTDCYLQTGEHLKEPIQFIRIERISALDGVTFAFDDETREPETIVPHAFEARDIVAVDGTSVRIRERSSIPNVAQTEVWRPDRTQMSRKNEYVLGQEDMAFIGKNFTEILSREANTSRHRDPQTGRYDGIQITGVRTGSTIERHGAQDGDVIKSINGQPVTSVPEAITFVKNNSDRFSRWEVVVENKGRERTMVYNSPEP